MGDMLAEPEPEPRQCRTCLHKQRKLHTINETIAHMLQEITQAQVKQDGLSQWVCSSCHEEIKRFCEFRHMCLESLKFLREIKVAQDQIKKEEPIEEDHLNFINIKFEPSSAKNENDDDDSIDCDDGDDISFTDRDQKFVIDISYKSDESKTSRGGDDLKEYKIKKIFACPYCHAPFTNKKIFNNHMELIHPDKRSENVQALIESSPPMGVVYKYKTADDLYKCSCGNFSSQDYLSLQKHFINHYGEKPVVCTLCDYRCANVSLLKKHMKVHNSEKPFSCSLCSYTCKKKTSLRIHAATHSAEKTHQCKQCPLTFKWASALSLHKAKDHDKKVYACNLCEKQFSTSDYLRKHMVVHTDERPHICHLCGHSFSRIGSLKKHLATMHESDEVARKFKCEVCNFSFKHLQDLNCHMSRHTGIKNYKCDQCPYLTSSSHNLKIHISRHAGVTRFSCDLCDYKCLEKSKLKIHQVIHTGERNFLCDLCSYAAATPTALKRHKETHSTELKHSCPNCSYKTNVRESLTKHMRKKCQVKRRESKSTVKDIIPSALIPEVIFNKTPKP